VWVCVCVCEAGCVCVCGANFGVVQLWVAGCGGGAGGLNVSLRVWGCPDHFSIPRKKHLSPLLHSHKYVVSLQPVVHAVYLQREKQTQ